MPRLTGGNQPYRVYAKAAHHDPNIIVTGRVPDIRSYLAVSSVVIVPLLQGVVHGSKF